MSEYCPTKDELVKHIEALTGLIDGQNDDELGSALTPIVVMLRKMLNKSIQKGDSVRDHFGENGCVLAVLHNDKYYIITERGHKVVRLGEHLIKTS